MLRRQRARDEAGEPPDRAPRPVQRVTEHERDGGGQQRQPEAVPQREVVAGLFRRGGRVGAGVALRVGVDHGVRDAEHEPADRTQPGRPGEQRPRRVRRDVGHAGLAGERAPEEPGAVGHGEDRACHQREGDEPATQVVFGDERLEAGLLADEAEQRRQAGHRRGRRAGGDGAAAQGGPQSRQLAYVAGAGRVVDDAGHEEQRRLEQAVREQHRDPCHGRDPRAGTEQDHQEPELAHGAEGQQPLEVVLRHRAPAADGHRGQAEHDDRHPPDGSVGDARGKPRHQVDARLHHRGRVQVGADRRRCGHRGREPGVEGQLCRLRQRADEDQRNGGRDRAALEATGLPERDDLRDPVGAGRLAQQDEPEQHHESAEHGDQQRLDRCAPVLPRLAALAHEQERRHRRQLEGRELARSGRSTVGHGAI